MTCHPTGGRPAPAAARIRPCRRLADARAAKWDGRWHYQVRGGSFQHEEGGAALVFSVLPTKILAFAKGNFSHTRHQF